MIKHLKPLVALAGLCLFSPVTAGAQDYRVVYDGSITSGSDPDNIFGLSNLETLTGLTFSASVSYTTSVPGTRTTTNMSDRVAGGFNFDADQVVSSVLFSIGDHEFSFSPDFAGVVYTSPTLLSTYDYDSLQNGLQVYFSPNGSSGPSSFGIPFSGAGTGDIGGAITQDSFLDAGQNDIIYFSATRATVAAVPEVGTWIMLLLGFGAVGFALRRRERGSTKSCEAV